MLYIEHNFKVLMCFCVSCFSVFFVYLLTINNITSSKLNSKWHVRPELRSSYVRVSVVGHLQCRLHAVDHGGSLTIQLLHLGRPAKSRPFSWSGHRSLHLLTLHWKMTNSVSSSDSSLNRTKHVSWPFTERWQTQLAHRILVLIGPNMCPDPSLKDDKLS